MESNSNNPRPEDSPGFGEPKIGDRVKLCGGHRWAGYSGTYIADREFYFQGESRPVVKIDNTREEVFVSDPETQMRKL
ncbi:MAG: hypothetical protein ABSE45_14905 [Candidatus Acidiferrales bacterium]|jgi:hypothetical protein